MRTKGGSTLSIANSSDAFHDSVKNTYRNSDKQNKEESIRSGPIDMPNFNTKVKNPLQGQFHPNLKDIKLSRRYSTEDIDK